MIYVKKHCQILPDTNNFCIFVSSFKQQQAMLKIQTKSSNSGSTKQYHIIIDENNVDIKSYAALVLLNEDLKYQDEEYQDKTSDIQIYLDKRYYYLSSKLIESGDLVCEYCGEKHLEVGHRLLKDSYLDCKNPKLATIDHIVPR